jgi:hypothetical protein
MVVDTQRLELRQMVLLELQIQVEAAEVRILVAALVKQAATVVQESSSFVTLLTQRPLHR